MAVPISRPSTSTQSYASPYAAPARPGDSSHMVAAGTILAAGALLAAGHRRAGVAVAVAGTAIALLEEQDAVKEWWRNVPRYLDDAQRFLDKVEGYLNAATTQGQRLQSILRR